jgi:hypothetical protein
MDNFFSHNFTWKRERGTVVAKRKSNSFKNISGHKQLFLRAETKKIYILTFTQVKKTNHLNGFHLRGMAHSRNVGIW